MRAHAQLHIHRITPRTVNNFLLQTYCRQECGIEIVISKQTRGSGVASEKEMRARISQQRTYFLFHRAPAAGSHAHDTKLDQQALRSKVLYQGPQFTRIPTDRSENWHVHEVCHHLVQTKPYLLDSHHHSLINSRSGQAGRLCRCNFGILLCRQHQFLNPHQSVATLFKD